MANVNGQTISRETVAYECLNRYGTDVLESIIDRMIVQQACEANGIQITADEIIRLVHAPAAAEVDLHAHRGGPLENGVPKVHAHVVVGKADATAHGGHLVEGVVRPTLEVVITETPAYLRRRFDAQSGLALIDPHARE